MVDIEGEFEAGDAVEVVCDGRAVGKGIVAYSSASCTDQGAEDGRGAGAASRATEEAVHRDYFVLD